MDYNTSDISVIRHKVKFNPDETKVITKFFEVDKEHLVAYSLSVLAKEQLIASKYAKEAVCINKCNTHTIRYHKADKIKMKGMCHA